MATTALNREPRIMAVPVFSLAMRIKHPLRLWLLGGQIMLAVIVGVAALASATGVSVLPYPLAVLDQRLPAIFRLHMLASGVGLLLLPAVLLLRHRPALHRPLGRMTALLFTAGCLAALPSAVASEAT